MTELSAFLAVLLAGIALIALGIAVGGAAFGALVLRPIAAPHAAVRAALARVLRWTWAAAITLAVSRVLGLMLVPLGFDDGLGTLALDTLFGTVSARATLVQAAAALMLACAAALAARRNEGGTGWSALAITAALVLASGAWLTHAASRIETPELLMLTTVAHQLGAAVWFGGIVHLALSRPLVTRDAAHPDLWPQLLARFSPLALASVLLLVAAGICLALRYIGDWAALAGTGYGAMVMAKIVLVAIALGFAWLNFSSVRRWRAYGDTQRAHRYVPAWLEAELAVVATALLTAASLSSQAPAADVPGEHATPQEVLAVIAPKRPTLTPPARDAFLANAASASDAFAAPSELDRVQNNFNHNIAGLLVFAIGIGAVVDRSGRLPAARHWPVLFLLLAVFLFLYAEPTVWPLGTESFWGTLAVPAVLQHRLATILVVALALFEWRVRAGTLGVTRWRFAFPLLCGVGGAMLLTHSHGVFVNKSEFLIEFSHAVLGLLALLVGVGRWLELRLPAASNRAGGMLWSACLIATGLVLLFYQAG